MTRPSWQDFATHDESAYPELWDGVVGAWCPSLGPTGTRLHDHSRWNNWGTITNMDPPTDWLVSDGQYALDFDGVNDHAALGTVDRLNPSEYTAAMWIKAAATTAGQKSILAQIDVTGNTGRAIRRNANQIEYAVANGGNYALYKAATTITTDWTHVAVTVSGVGTPRIWINGVESTVSLTASSGTVTLPAAQPCMIGIDGQFGTTTTLYNFAGLIDDVTVYNRRLASNEIRRLYLLGRGGMYERRRRTLRRVAIEQATGARRRRIICGGNC